MNHASLVGRLTRDPEIRYSQGDNPLCIARFTLACDRRFKKQGDEQTADFISCKAFGKTAEFIEKYFSKGRRIGISGRIETGSYTNRDGQKVYTTEVIAEEAEFVDNKSDNNTSNNDTSNNNTPAQKPDDNGFMHIPDGIDEVLPFN